ncbi:MAG: SCO1664 family protein [Thermomicrobiales bacterium]
MPDLFLELRESDDSAGAAPPPPLSDADALVLLRESEIVASRLIPWGSNYSFAVALEALDGRDQLAIYKPRNGEAPLYDFPDGTLYLRETAAYLLGKLLGWDFVPPTIVRSGPHGIGSLQLYVYPEAESAASQQYWQGCAPEIERVVLFDHIANNADRKIGHCLRDHLGRVWGIDHGLTFNQVPKMRTVLWQYVGQPISPTFLDDVVDLRRREPEVRAALREYLNRAEVDALFARTDRLIETGHYPLLNARRNIPYGWW